jgi:hypothetical protein
MLARRAQPLEDLQAPRVGDRSQRAISVHIDI